MPASARPDAAASSVPIHPPPLGRVPLVRSASSPPSCLRRAARKITTGRGREPEFLDAVFTATPTPSVPTFPCSSSPEREACHPVSVDDAIARAEERHYRCRVSLELGSSSSSCYSHATLRLDTTRETKQLSYLYGDQEPQNLMEVQSMKLAKTIRPIIAIFVGILWKGHKNETPYLSCTNKLLNFAGADEVVTVMVTRAMRASWGSPVGGTCGGYQLEARVDASSLFLRRGWEHLEGVTPIGVEGDAAPAA
ncbi:hypothetical protein EJB05_54573, partial [Eragrostis curvula]